MILYCSNTKEIILADNLLKLLLGDIKPHRFLEIRGHILVVVKKDVVI